MGFFFTDKSCSLQIIEVFEQKLCDTGYDFGDEIGAEFLTIVVLKRFGHDLTLQQQEHTHTHTVCLYVKSA